MEIELFYLFILIITGLGVGFTTGLLGVGGGFILVPILYFTLLNLGIEPTLAIRIAFGTSLAIIIPTAISSAYAHHREKQVKIKASLYMGLTGFTGALLGGYVATHTPGDILRILFGLVLLLVAIRMLLFREPQKQDNHRENIIKFLVIGFTAGILSGLVGIGGGIILIPAMVFFMGYDMKKAGANSSVIIIFTSLGGIISYIVNGMNVSGLPAYSWGYVNILQLIIIVLFSIPMAQLGGRMAQKAPEKLLRYIFITILVLISLEMLEIFEWLAIPV